LIFIDILYDVDSKNITITKSVIWRKKPLRSELQNFTLRDLPLIL